MKNTQSSAAAEKKKKKGCISLRRQLPRQLRCLHLHVHESTYSLFVWLLVRTQGRKLNIREAEENMTRKYRREMGDVRNRKRELDYCKKF